MELEPALQQIEVIEMPRRGGGRRLPAPLARRAARDAAIGTEGAAVVADQARHGEQVVVGAQRVAHQALGSALEAASTADGQGALLRVRGRTVWQFRCRGGRLSIEDSLWIGGDAGLRETSQLVVAGDSPADGTAIAWIFRRAG